MGELDDALAGLRAEALAAASTEWERVRAARRRYVARRATTAALAVALLLGGGAIAAANTGLLTADRGEHLLVTPAPEPTPTPVETASGDPTPSPSDAPATTTDVTWTGLSLLDQAGTLLGRRCDADQIECDVLARATSDGGRTFTREVLVSHATYDPDVQSAADHTAGSVLETPRGSWLYGASLFYGADRVHWTEVKVTGIVTAVLDDGMFTVAVIQQCKTSFPAFAGCRLVLANLDRGQVTSSVTYPMSDGEQVRDVAGTPGDMVVQLADDQAVQRELVGAATALTSRDSVCKGNWSVSVVADDQGLLALCGAEPFGGGNQDKKLYQLKADRWEPLGSPEISGSQVRLYNAGRRLVALPGRGPVSVSTDGGASWAEVLPELDGDAVLGVDVTMSGDEIILLSGPDDPQMRQIWRSSDGSRWAGARIS